MSQAISKSFTAAGHSQDFRVPAGQAFTYAITGTFVGTWEVQRFYRGGWVPDKRGTDTASGSLVAQDPNADAFITYRTACTKFTSGTIVTAVSVDPTSSSSSIKDNTGADVAQATEDGLVIPSGKKLVGGATLVSATAATLALTQAAHDGQSIILNRAGGVAVTLPNAIGSGARFRLGFGTALSSASHTIAVADNTDYLRGQVVAASHTDGTPKGWKTANTGTVATESDTMTFDGATQGGLVGDFVELVDVAAHVWQVRGFVTQAATEASPFSANV